MKKFKDFQPTAMDSKGVGSEGQEDWLVLPTSRTRDTGPLEESNFAAALERLGGESDTVQVHRFGHWGPGWFEIIVVHPSRESEAEEIEKSLENYPVLDEDDMSRRESDEAEEDWKNWGKNEFTNIIKRNFEIDEEQEDMLDYYVDLTALWREVSNHLGWSEQHDGHSTIFNFSDATKYLIDNPDLVYDAIDAAHSSPEYLAAQKKAENEKLERWRKATRGYNPPLPNTFPLLEVNGRIFTSHKDAYGFAMDRANESGEEVVIMQKDDSMLPWFMLQKIYPHSAGITGRSPLSEQRYYEEMDKSQSSNPSGENPPTAYIDFAGGAFEMWENVDGDRHRLGRSESIGNLAHQIRDYGYKRVVLTAEAADRDVDRHGWCLLGQGSPGGSPGNAYGKASEYLKSSLRGVDIRPNPERFDPAYRVFGYGRKGRISAGMMVKIAGTNQRGRVVMPSSEPNHWVINIGGRHGTPKVVHEDNLITRGG